MCRVFSCVVGRGCLLWPVHFIGKALLVFFLLHSIFQGQICLLLHGFLDFLLFHCSHLLWKGHIFWLLYLEGLIGFHKTVQFQLLQHYWSGHRFGLLYYWMVCKLGNEQRSFCHFWDFIKYCILDSFVDYDGYSISSKGFLLTVVDIMINWVNFTHSSRS